MTANDIIDAVTVSVAIFLIIAPIGWLVGLVLVALTEWIMTRKENHERTD